jgi:hypothetical protein
MMYRFNRKKLQINHRVVPINFENKQILILHITANWITDFNREDCRPKIACIKPYLIFSELEVVGQQIPRSIFGKCNALFAYLRLCIAAIYICLYHRDADLVFCDQVF